MMTKRSTAMANWPLPDLARAYASPPRVGQIVLGG